jgi:serine phosphatase RsbU (regulator of sigma subunit)
VPAIIPDLLPEFEAESLRRLRRRFLFFAAAGAILSTILLSAVLSVGGQTSPSGAPAWVAALLRLAPFAAVAQVLTFLVPPVMMLGSREPWSRRRILRTVAAIVTISPFLQLPTATASIGLIEEGLALAGYRVDFGPAIAVLLQTLGIHFLASLLMPWTVREAAAPAVPFLGIFLVAIVAGVLTGDSDFAAAGLALLAILLVLAPGLSISWFRHSRFAAHFQNRAVRLRYDELATELSLARRIHERLFPAPINDGPVRLAFAYEPMRQIGGDFLFARSGPPERPWLSIALIDVTGHGIAAALAVNRLHGELDRIFGTHPDPPPGFVLAELNRYFHLSMAAESIYATALCLRIDPADDSLRWASAAHPPAILSIAGADPCNIAATTFILGAAPHGSFDPEEQSTPFPPGSSLLAYTDGAFELRLHDGTMLGLRGLTELAARSRTSASWNETLLGDLKSRRAGAPTDDILIVQVTRP